MHSFYRELSLWFLPLYWLSVFLSVCQWWSSVSVTGYRRMRWCWSGWPSAPTRTDSNSTWTTWTSLSMRLQYTFFLCVCTMKYDACSSGRFFCSSFVQVLNKRKKSKQNARKEAFNRTRDIHTIQDLYPPHLSRFYRVLPAFSYECL